MKTDKLLKLIQQKKAMRSGGALPLPKAQGGLQYVPNGTYGNYYDPATQQYIPQVYLPEVNIVADKSLPFQNGKFAPFLAARGMAEYVPIESMLLPPGTPVVKGLGKVGNVLLDAVNPLQGMNLGQGLKNLKQEIIYRGITPVGYGAKQKAAMFLPNLLKYRSPKDKVIDIATEFERGVSTSPSYRRKLREKIQRQYDMSPEEYDKLSATEKMDLYPEMQFKDLIEQSKKRTDSWRTGLGLDQVYDTFDIVDGKYRIKDSAISPGRFSSLWNDISASQLRNKVYAGDNPLVYLTKKHEQITSPKIKTEYGDFSINDIRRYLRKNSDDIKPWEQTRIVEPARNKEFGWSIYDADPKGVMGQMRWDVSETPEGMLHFQANDTWDLHPWAKRGSININEDALMQKTANLHRKKFLEDIELLDLLGGKPFDIQNNYIVDPKTMQIVKERKTGGTSNMNTNKMLNYINAIYQKGGGIKDMVVSEIWEKVTGTKWSQAKKMGLTDGSFDSNLKLRQMLINEAAQSKPNFGKFVGKGQYKVPAASGVINQLRQEALGQAAQSQGARPNVYPSPVVGRAPVAQPAVQPVAARPGKPQPVAPRSSALNQMINAAANQTASRGSTMVAPPVMSPVVGRAPVPPKQAAEKPRLVPVTPPMGQPTYPQQDESGSMFPDLSTMGTVSMLNMLPIVGGVQAANTFGPMLAGNAARGLYDATIGPEIDYYTDPNSAVLPNLVRGVLPLPLNAANSVSYLLNSGMAMDDRSLSDEEKRVVYQTARDAAKKGKSSFTYEDFADQGQGGADLYTQKLKRGKIGFIDAIKESLTNPAFNVASTIGGSNFKFLPDSSLQITNVSDWNPEDANFSNPNSPYQYYRNFLRNVNRARIKNMTPEERAAEDKKNTISLTIPPSIMQEQKAGGAKRSLKIRIRKNG